MNDVAFGNSAKRNLLPAPERFLLVTLVGMTNEPLQRRDRHLSMTILLIAYGNSMRRDDGAGLALANIIEQIWRSQDVTVRRLSIHQLTPELAADMAEPDISAVVFVDACVADDPDQALIPTIRPLSQAVDMSPTIGHHLSPELLMVYSAKLYDKTPPCWMITIPGVDFGVGDALSEPVKQALAGSEALIEDWRRLIVLSGD